MKFTESEKKEIDLKFTYEDFTAALKGMARNKTPGNSGLPMEFYVMFWMKIGNYVWQAMEILHQKGYLYLSARRGIVSLIPKKDKDPMLIKNWRPITLLNTDHKNINKNAHE